MWKLIIRNLLYYSVNLFSEESFFTAFNKSITFTKIHFMLLSFGRPTCKGRQNLRDPSRWPRWLAGEQNETPRPWAPFSISWSDHLKFLSWFSWFPEKNLIVFPWFYFFLVFIIIIINWQSLNNSLGRLGGINALMETEGMTQVTFLLPPPIFLSLLGQGTSITRQAHFPPASLGDAQRHSWSPRWA